MTDDEGTIEAGCGIQTAIKSATLLECGERIKNLLSTGVFAQDVLAGGNIYNELGQKAGEVRWDFVMTSSDEIPEGMTLQ